MVLGVDDRPNVRLLGGKAVLAGQKPQQEVLLGRVRHAFTKGTLGEGEVAPKGGFLRQLASCRLLRE